MKTNFDRIKEMNKSEFAEFLDNFRPSDAWVAVEWSAQDGNEDAKALFEKRDSLSLDSSALDNEAINLWLGMKYDPYYFYDDTDADWG